MPLKHRRPTRWFHWFNFPLLSLMLWSGLLIYWANDVYKIQLGNHLIFHFFPKRFYVALFLPHRLAEGMAWHFFVQWLFTLNGFLYVLYTAASGEWRSLIPTRNSFPAAWKVLLHDLGLRKEMPPQGKYNAAQQIAYTGIILCGVLSVLSGYAIYKPVQLHWLRSVLGGYEFSRGIHFVVAMSYVPFLLVHIIQVARAGWNNFRSMVTGYEKT